MPEPAPGPAVARANLERAFALLDGLASAGLRHVVVSPGSRSTPLALAAGMHPGLRTWVRIDERSAAFFALGLARGEGTPAAVIATSGSAPTHWYPAVVESEHALVPLILLSADRPPELHGCGANQTIDQQALFGVHVRGFHNLAPEVGCDVARRLGADAGRLSSAPVPGPVHVNIQFREPLVPDAVPELTASSRGGRVSSPVRTPGAGQMDDAVAAMTGAPGVIACGWGRYRDGFPKAVTTLAARMNVPVIADPLSGLRRGDHDTGHVITAADTFLRDPAFLREQPPAWVLRFGAYPVSRAFGEYLDAPGNQVVLVDPWDRRADPGRRAALVIRADEVEVCRALLERKPAPAPPEWFAAFELRERQAVSRLQKGLAEPPFHEGDIIAALCRGLPPGTVLFSGNSLPVRQLDTHLRAGPALEVMANRGVSGIDGNLSTVLGLAGAGRRVAGLLGDVAFSHDLGALAQCHGLDATVVVVNNGGGAIFGYLPQAGLQAFEQLWLTPPGLDLQRAASLFGVAWRRVHTADEFEDALGALLQRPGVRIIEAVVDRQASEAYHRALWDAHGR